MKITFKDVTKYPEPLPKPKQVFQLILDDLSLQEVQVLYQVGNWSTLLGQDLATRQEGFSANEIGNVLVLFFEAFRRVEGIKRDY